MTLPAYLASRADRVADIPILQPADPFLEVAGEDLRRRIFVTQGQDGTDLCLRPEFTIPVLRDALATGARGRFAVHGPVFRQDRDGAAEFAQAGIEDIGDTNTVAADARCLADAHAALAAGGLRETRTVLGDDALFRALCQALDLPVPVTERLERAFADADRLRRTIEQFSAAQPAGGTSEEDAAAVRTRVEGLMSEASLPATGGRTAQAIAERTVARARLGRYRLADRARQALGALLSLDLPLVEASDALDALCRDHAVDLTRERGAFRARVEAMAAAGLDLAPIRYRGAFGRKLDYYSALQFDIFAPGHEQPVAGGGRYDGLAALLGHAGPLPGVGFSIQLDRLAEVTA